MKLLSNIRLGKKWVIMIAGSMLVIIACYLLIVPLIGKVRQVGREVKTLENEMIAARQAIESKEKFQQSGELLTRKKVSLAIDEITKSGAAHNISFLSISPQKIVKPADSKYPILPIQMNLQSSYSDLGIFLGALEDLKQSIISIQSFEIDAEADILPSINTDLVVEVYLQEGEDG